MSNESEGRAFRERQAELALTLLSVGGKAKVAATYLINLFPQVSPEGDKTRTGVAEEQTWRAMYETGSAGLRATQAGIGNARACLREAYKRLMME